MLRCTTDFVSVRCSPAEIMYHEFIIDSGHSFRRPDLLRSNESDEEKIAKNVHIREYPSTLIRNVILYYVSILK